MRLVSAAAFVFLLGSWTLLVSSQDTETEIGTETGTETAAETDVPPESEPESPTVDETESSLKESHEVESEPPPDDVERTTVSQVIESVVAEGERVAGDQDVADPAVQSQTQDHTAHPEEPANDLTATELPAEQDQLVEFDTQPSEATHLEAHSSTPKDSSEDSSDSSSESVAAPAEESVAVETSQPELSKETDVPSDAHSVPHADPETNVPEEHTGPADNLEPIATELTVTEPPAQPEESVETNEPLAETAHLEVHSTPSADSSEDSSVNSSEDSVVSSTDTAASQPEPVVETDAPSDVQAVPQADPEDLQALVTELAPTVLPEPLVDTDGSSTEAAPVDDHSTTATDSSEDFPQKSEEDSSQKSSEDSSISASDSVAVETSNEPEPSPETKVEDEIHTVSSDDGQPSVTEQTTSEESVPPEVVALPANEVAATPEPNTASESERSSDAESQDSTETVTALELEKAVVPDDLQPSGSDVVTTLDASSASLSSDEPTPIPVDEVIEQAVSVQVNDVYPSLTPVPVDEVIGPVVTVQVNDVFPSLTPDPVDEVIEQAVSVQVNDVYPSLIPQSDTTFQAITDLVVGATDDATKHSEGDTVAPEVLNVDKVAEDDNSQITTTNGEVVDSEVTTPVAEVELKESTTESVTKLLTTYESDKHQNSVVIIKIHRDAQSPEMLLKLRRAIARAIAQSRSAGVSAGVNGTQVLRLRRDAVTDATVNDDFDEDSVQFVEMGDSDDKDSILIGVIVRDGAPGSGGYLTSEDLTKIISAHKDEIETAFGAELSVDPAGLTALESKETSEPVPAKTLWERYFSLFLTVIILLIISLLIMILCCICLRCRQRDGTPEKTPMSLEEGRTRQLAASNPISDDEIVRDEAAPMQECPNPALPYNGGGQHISKYDEDDGWVVPLDELHGLNQHVPSIENTRL